MTDIVTITPAELAAGGPALMVPQIFNGMWNASATKTLDAKNAVDAAIAQASPAPHMGAIAVAGGYVPPLPPTIPTLDPNEAEALYYSIYNQLHASIADGLTYFMATYFPDTGYFDDALAWIDSAIKTGGSGIRPAVEQQLWERGRARILGDSQRAEAEAMSTWADRRFPMPPGALVDQVNQIRLDAGRKLAETNRDIAVKSFDAELENVRFAVKSAVDVRTSALAAAGDYIKTIMLGPQTAASMASTLTEAQARAAQTLTQMYSAQVAAAEPFVRLSLGTADIQARVGEANLRSDSSALDARVRAAMGYAEMLGTQAPPASTHCTPERASAVAIRASSDQTIGPAP